MKILLVSKELYPFYYGGIGVVYYSMATSFSKMGHEVKFLTRRPDNYDHNVLEREYGSVPVVWVGYEPGRFSQHSALDYAYQMAESFTELEKEWRADLVICSEYDGEPFFLLSNWRKGVYGNLNIILRLEGPLALIYKAEARLPKSYEQVIFRMEESCIASAKNILTPSIFLKSSLTHLLDDNSQHIVTAPNPVHPLIFPQPIAHKEVPEKIIVFVGKLQKNKGADLALKSFLRLMSIAPHTQVKMFMVGADVFWEDYGEDFTPYWKKHIPKDLEKSVVFTGQLSQIHLKHLLTRAWLGIFPSQFEAFGNVALEALYCGLPILVNKDTGLGDVVGDEYPIAIRAEDDAEKICQKIKSLINDSTLYEKVLAATALRAKVIHNTQDGLLDTLISLLKDKTTQDHTPVTNIDSNVLYHLCAYYETELKESISTRQTILQTREQAFRSYEDDLRQQIDKAWREYDKKNSELETVWLRYNSETTKLWQQIDDRDKQLSELWEKHTQDTKDAWAAADKKDEQLVAAWQTVDTKDSELAEFWKQYNKREAMLLLEISELQQQISAHQFKAEETLRNMQQSHEHQITVLKENNSTLQSGIEDLRIKLDLIVSSKSYKLLQKLRSRLSILKKMRLFC